MYINVVYNIIMKDIILDYLILYVFLLQVIKKQKRA